ncbi:MAG TPA: hypothetical protein VG842_02865, partial [Sediminibacterium sp.]|nr:hypothetical protein [Sediminibacterium sp.]
ALTFLYVKPLMVLNRLIHERSAIFVLMNPASLWNTALPIPHQHGNKAWLMLTIYKKILLGIYAIASCITGFGQPKIMQDSRNGTYQSSWSFNGNTNDTGTVYLRLGFLNDSTFLICFNGSKPENFRINSLGYMDFWIGRMINFNGIKKWYAIRDHTLLGNNPVYEQSFSDNRYRLDFAEAVNFYLNTPHDSNQLKFNPYDVFEVLFLHHAVKILKIWNDERDNGELGDHVHIDNEIIDFNLDSSSSISNNREEDINNSFRKGYITSTTSSRYLPIPEKVQGNELKSLFKKGEMVFISRQTYMNFAFVIATNTNNNIMKYGWVKRNFIRLQKPYK